MQWLEHFPPRLQRPHPAAAGPASAAALRRQLAEQHRQRDAERKRLARELHDELGQALAALKLEIDLLAASLPAGAGVQPARRRIATLRGRLRTAMAATRRLCRGLRPRRLDELGLEAALEGLIQQHVGDGARCDLAIRGARPARVPAAIALALYRIAQESLTNIARHAHARRARVTLDYRPDGVRLRISDDGRGFGSGGRRGHQAAGLGLRGIVERAQELGGRAAIDSRRGAGTRIEVTLPLPAPGADEEPPA